MCDDGAVAAYFDEETGEIVVAEPESEDEDDGA